MKLLKDLFYGVGNRHLDLARVSAFLALCASLAAIAWNIYLGQPIDLGVTGLPAGLALLLPAIGALIALKDRARNAAPPE